MSKAIYDKLGESGLGDGFRSHVNVESHSEDGWIKVWTAVIDTFPTLGGGERHEWER